ncbi:hypothetical protein WJS89_10930 [Sphingomicrobium sp. XHP0235]|uniref:hypothetical protein n=1 Tax=Sphingomicrobium aquimarinum TaxID=3133971 RepID=UPI0031FEFAC7
MRLLITTAIATAVLALSACADSDEATTDMDATNEMASDDMAADATPAAAETGVTNANDATEAQLAAMDGMTPELAAAIVAGQPYADVVAFNEVLMGSLDEAQAASVRERLFVPINLNDASEEAIRLVPGMTDKMVHEFEEYRPYEDLAEFDREIGKYVDEAEVARFRQYVTL